MHSFYKMRNDLHDEWFFKNPQYFMWWCDLMHLASWKSETVMVGSIPVSLNRGQLIASINDLVKRWNRSKDMIIKYIKVLETKGLIIKTTKNNISIITILDYDLEDDTDNLADNPEHVQNTDKQSTFKRLNGQQTDNLVDNLNTTDNHADNHADNLPVAMTDNHADNPKRVQNPNKQRLSKNLMGKQADNLADNFPAVTTDNHADNLADSYIIYKEERIKKSTSTTRVRKCKEGAVMNIVENVGISSGNNCTLATSEGIRKLLGEEKSLLLLQRESGFSAKEVKLWIVQFGRSWEAKKPWHNDYQDLFSHVLDTLIIKRKNNEKPKKLFVNNESSAREIWNIIQADLCMQHPDGVSVLGKLNFFGFCGNDISLVAPSRDVKETVKEKYIALINEQFEKYSDSPIKVKCGTIKEQKNN